MSQSPLGLEEYLLNIYIKYIMNNNKHIKKFCFLQLF